MKTRTVSFLSAVLVMLLLAGCTDRETTLKVLYWNVQNGMWADQGNDYDNFVYSLSSYSKYVVEDGFPRISRDKIALPIIKVQYEIVLSNIEVYKQK